MRRKIEILLVLILIFFTLHFISLQTAYAVCPVCTVAVGAGLGLSRYFGIDDSVSGIWVGGLIVSLSFWTTAWINKKKFVFFQKSHFILPYILSAIFYILITFPPLFWVGIIGHPYNTIFGMDKLIFGSIVGTLSFLLGVYSDKKIRKIKGKQFFNYQKVVFPVLSLVIASLLIYYYGGYLL